MAYNFVNQQKAKAFVQEAASKYNLAGVNGQQTNANNFRTAIMGLLYVVGKDYEAEDLGRTITQDVVEE